MKQGHPFSPFSSLNLLASAVNWVTSIVSHDHPIGDIKIVYDGYHRHFVQDKADWDETDYTINYLQGAIDGELEFIAAC